MMGVVEDACDTLNRKPSGTTSIFPGKWEVEKTSAGGFVVYFTSSGSTLSRTDVMVLALVFDLALDKEVLLQSFIDKLNTFSDKLDGLTERVQTLEGFHNLDV